VKVVRVTVNSVKDTVKVGKVTVNSAKVVKVTVNSVRVVRDVRDTANSVKVVKAAVVAKVSAPSSGMSKWLL